MTWPTVCSKVVVPLLFVHCLLKPPYFVRFYACSLFSALCGGLVFGPCFAGLCVHPSFAITSTQ